MSLRLGHEDDILESDTEGDVNRVGDIDMSLYDEDEHAGYTIGGQRVAKTFSSTEIENFLRRKEPGAWRTVHDLKNQTSYRLTDRDLEIITRIREGRLGVAPLNEEDFQVEYEFNEGHLPLMTASTSKKGYQPGHGDEKKIRHIVKLIKSGQYVTREERVKKQMAKAQELQDIWGNDILVAYDDKGRPIKPVLPAPKPPLPGHAESYNPSPEYLMTSEEEKQWHATHPDDRLTNFVPKSHQSMRHVGAYENLLQESFERCLDLYLCPRSLRENWIENSSDLLPKLPSLDQFKPFPRTPGITVKDHGAGVCSLAFDDGVLAAGYRDGSLAIHNIASHPFYLPEFCVKTQSRGTSYSINDLKFHPLHPLLIFSRAQYLFVCLVRRPQTSFMELQHLVKQYWGNDQTIENIPPHLVQYVDAIDAMRATSSEVPLYDDHKKPTKIGEWRGFRSLAFFANYVEGAGDDDGLVVTSGDEDEDTSHQELIYKDWKETCKFIELLITHNKYIVAGYVISLGVKPEALTVHSKGAYVATASPAAPTASSQSFLHHLKKKRSLAPFRKITGHGAVESVAFHPSKPYLIVGFPKSICIYDLTPKAQVHIVSKEGESNKSMAHIVQKFKGSENATAMEVFEAAYGLHILRVTVNGKFQWYDCEYGSMPYKTIEVVDTGSLVSVRHHPNLPLIAAGTSLSHIHLFHAVPDDLTEMQITPLVRLADKSSHVTALAWNLRNHWLASGHSNGRIIIWV